MLYTVGAKSERFSYVQTSADSREHARIDLPGLCDYVRAYLEYAPLTRADLAAAPYVYLFQLARSKFGYAEYLQTDSEDREGLLAFAFWRTDMCREVERRAEEIARALVQCGEESRHREKKPPEREGKSPDSADETGSSQSDI